MDIFGTPNIEQMVDNNDYEGLLKALEHRNKFVRLQAAQALAQLNDGTGWRYLFDTVRQFNDPEAQDIAVAMLGELGHPRAVPVLGETLIKARFDLTRGELAVVLREALINISGAEAEEALLRAGYDPKVDRETDLEADEPSTADFDAHFVRPILPNTSQIHFQTAEEHLNNAVQLREAEATERGMVECSLALWLTPDWAYAWYLRGVLFEDLDRLSEARLAYQRAVELDPTLKDAQDALAELSDEVELITTDLDVLIAQLEARDWQARRNAAAEIGHLALHGTELAREAVDALIERLQDEEREVRHTAIEALGLLDDRRALLPILNLVESSWLVRFAILEALARLGSIEGLVTALRNEMNRMQERNLVFSSHKDPLLEVEYDTLMEIGVRAMEHTGDIESLLVIAEGNAWEEVDEPVEDENTAEEGVDELGDYIDEGDEDEDALQEDLTSFVDETAEMVVIALERLATKRIPELKDELLQRLTLVPDLTLMDVSEEETEPVVVHDLSVLREAAQAELSRRKAKSLAGS